MDSKKDNIPLRATLGVMNQGGGQERSRMGKVATEAHTKTLEERALYARTKGDIAAMHGDKPLARLYRRALAFFESIGKAR